MTREKIIALAGQVEPTVRPSTLAAFLEALNGRRGDLDAWLECNNEAEVRAHVLALVKAEREDAARIDWLEAQVNTNGAIHLHDGKSPYGLGLGLRPGYLVRTLREAIDSARPKGDPHG